MRKTNHSTVYQHPDILGGMIDDYGGTLVDPKVLSGEVFEDGNLILLIRDAKAAHMKLYTDRAPAQLWKDAQIAFPDAEDIESCLTQYFGASAIQVFRIQNMLALLTKLEQIGWLLNE